MFTRKGKGSTFFSFGSNEKIANLRYETQQFCVKCLGNAVLPDTATDSCDKAIKKLKEGGNIFNSMYVNIRMSVANGIEVIKGREELLSQCDLDKIPFCFVSDEYPSVFAFLCNEGYRILCNVFQCTDEIEASSLYDEMSKVFKSAHQVKKYEDQQREARLSEYNDSDGGGYGTAAIKRCFKRKKEGDCDYSTEADGLMGKV